MNNNVKLSKLEVNCNNLQKFNIENNSTMN